MRIAAKSSWRICRVDMPVINQLDRDRLRRRFAHGMQTLFSRSSNCIAFSRSGTEEDPGLLLVVLSMATTVKNLTARRRNYANKTGVIFWETAMSVFVTVIRRATFFCNAGLASACGS